MTPIFCFWGKKHQYTCPWERSSPRGILMRSRSHPYYAVYDIMKFFRSVLTTEKDSFLRSRGRIHQWTLSSPRWNRENSRQRWVPGQVLGVFRWKWCQQIPGNDVGLSQRSFLAQVSTQFSQEIPRDPLWRWPGLRISPGQHYTDYQEERSFWGLPILRSHRSCSTPHVLCPGPLQRNLSRLSVFH